LLKGLTGTSVVPMLGIFNIPEITTKAKTPEAVYQ
jgi:hypothetical protein